MLELLEEGLYELKVESVDPMHSALDDSSVYAVELRDDEIVCFAYAANNERARQAFWCDLADHFDDLPEVVGRTFLFPIRVAQITEHVAVNAVGAPLLEVLHES
jgi:hypothetical protein